MATHWSNVMVVTDGQGHDYRDAETIRTALAELRRTGGCRGRWICSAAELDAYQGHDSADAGLGREDIDWTGFEG